MRSTSLRFRSIGWFVTGALLSATVMLVFANAWSVDAAPGDTDATFVAITPCRLADTRPAPNRVGTAGALGVAATQAFAVHGSNGECTMSADAVAVSLNVTALGATQQSFLTFWPDGDQPLAASLNPAPGEPPTPNAVTVGLSDAGAFNVFNNAGTVDVVIDINGYYTQTSLKELTASVQELTARLSALEATAAGQPFAVTNRDDQESVLADDEEVIVSVDVTAPTAGQVTVNSTTNALVSTAGHGARCSITVEMDLDSTHIQYWESPGPPAGYTQLAGTRTFDIAAGSTVTYHLVCDYVGLTGGMVLSDSVVTAIFTPAT